MAREVFRSKVFSVFVLAVLSSVVGTTAASSREIALTFDDAPRGDGRLFPGAERTEKLIERLRDSAVEQAAFFCNTKPMNEAGKRRIEKYASAGHVIANHTHSHPDFHQTSLADYVADFRKAHDVLTSFSTFRKWFRFPFLREGETVQKRDGMRAELERAGYRNGYVTVDNCDWYMEALVQRALADGKRVRFDRLRRTYVRVLVDNVEFYDALAQRTLGRSPKHVLLLHENDLAALYVSDLVAALKQKGWKTITADDAYTDPIAAIEPDTLFLGQGRVAAIAHANGDSGPFGQWESEVALDTLFARERVFE